MIRMSMIPARTASSTTYWIAGLSTIGSISLGVAFVAGKNRVPSPAAGTTAFVTGAKSAMNQTLVNPQEPRVHDIALKATVRRSILERRAALTDDQRADAGRALRDALLDLPQVEMAASVAAYIAVGTEPPTSG